MSNKNNVYYEPTTSYINPSYLPSTQQNVLNGTCLTDRFINVNQSNSSNNNSNSHIVYTSQDIVEGKTVLGSKQIYNKYGLGVRILEKTPRNSNSNMEIKQINSKPVVNYINSQTYQPIVKWQVESVQSQTPNKTEKSVLNNHQNFPLTPLSQSNYAISKKKDLRIDLNSVFENTNETNASKSKFEIESKIKEVNVISSEVLRIEIEGVGTYEGTFRGDNMHGFGKLFDSKKRIVFEGEFADNHFEGLGILNNYGFGDKSWHEADKGHFSIPLNWIRYEGLFHESKQCGMSYLFYANDSTFFGEFEEGEANGFGTFTFSSGRTLKGIWNRNELVERF
jgi:hypothetical protein